MLHISVILIALAALIAALLLLRHRWSEMTWRTRKLLLLAAVLFITLFVLAYATHWVTAYDRLNSAIYWAAIAGYLLLLTVHSLTRPRWLTIATAIILAIPILASSIVLPLGGLFFPRPRRIRPLGDHLYASWQPFQELGTTTSGVDVEVVYRPRLVPFLQQTRLGGRFYDLRCNGAATEVALQPDHQSVFVRCPPWPNSGGSGEGDILRLH